MDELIDIKVLITYNIIFTISFNYEKYYNELLKNALKYGISRNDFWYGINYKDYFIYEEAYYEKLHYEAHIQGFYNYIAFNTVLANMFRKQGENAIEYPNMDIYTEMQEKAKKSQKTTQKITKENLQEVYVNRLANCY